MSAHWIELRWRGRCSRCPAERERVQAKIPDARAALAAARRAS